MKPCICGKPLKRRVDKQGYSMGYSRTCGELVCVRTRTVEMRANISRAAKRRWQDKKKPGYRYTGRTTGFHVSQHRKVVQDRLGRALKSSEVVHHWDENKENNANENLHYFRSSGAHSRLHFFAKRHGLPIIEFYFEQPWLHGKTVCSTP